ncbi:MAG: PaREP1 family protein [Caldivirga sp.]|nr:PaREP1 family protein [Caldivirga sp.]
MRIPREVEELLRREAYERGIDVELLLIDKLAKDLDPAIKVSLYLNKAEELFKEALDYLNRGDLIQASEKAWGACASVVKAYAEGKGMEHYRHRQLEEAMSRLISERGGDKELISGWGTCLRLHSNFYEGFMTRQDLEASLELVRGFLNRMRSEVQNSKPGGNSIT